MRSMLIHVNTAETFSEEKKSGASRPFEELRAWMKDNYTKVSYCFSNCGVCAPDFGIQFEVLEALEYPANCHEKDILPPGRYEVITMGGGSTSHQIRLLNLDTGEEKSFNYGYDAQFIVDWRGTRELVPPQPL